MSIWSAKVRIAKIRSRCAYLRIYMARLRHKLEADPAQPRYLLTETGVGYRCVPEGSA